MNGIHDMGGMQGLGEIGYRANEPGFHEPWEVRVFALVQAMRS
jgi:nitrile hydratase subunit beta